MIEWIPVNLSNNHEEDSGAFWLRFEELEDIRSTVFSTGNLVRFEDGRILLVGDINQNRGFCGCCCVGDATVVAYSKVFDMETVD